MSNRINILDDKKFLKLTSLVNKISEDASYGAISFQHGYGSLSKVTAEVQQGATVNLKIDMSFETLETKQYREWTEKEKNIITEEKTIELEKSHKKSGRIGWFYSLFGWLDGRSYDYYEKQKSENIRITDNAKSKSINRLFEKEKRKVTVKGDISITGSSLIPTKASVYIEMLKIKTANGDTLTVLSNNIKAATSTGEIDDIEITKNTINII